VLEVSGLRKEFAPRGVLGGSGESFVAVEDVSFTLDRGGSIGIVGESGAGKSTVARMLVGLESPSAGSIELAGRQITGNASRSERRRIARSIQMVYQDPFTSLDPMQRVGDAIEETLHFHFDLSRDERRRRMERLFEDVGLSPDHARAYPASLSGGQRQRVAIMRALAAEPEVLVLDEHVAALDVSIQAQVLNMLTEIQRERGVAFVVISHDLAVIRHTTSRIIVMRRGEVVESGNTEAVLDSPRSEYTRLLKASVPGPGWVPERSSPR